MKVSIWKKFKLFFEYKKIIKENKTKLLTKFNLRIDWSKRLYTVLNIPENIDIDKYGSDVQVNKQKFEFENKLSHSYIQKYIASVDKHLKKIGLQELVGIYDIRKIDNRNYLLIFGYTLFDSASMGNKLIAIILAAVIGLIIFFI